MAIRKTHSEIITQFLNTHGSKYDYSKIQYKNMYTHVEIICKTHGHFWQQPRAHLKGQGCPKCTQSENWTPTRDLESFLIRAREIHGTKYDYRHITNYKNCRQKLKISCPAHGCFIQLANSHLNGRGCPKCANNIKKTTEQFVEQANKTHKDIYDYSKANYKNAFTKITITCKTHGDFQQLANSHLNGQGCPKCGFESTLKSITKTKEQFIAECTKKHYGKYEYEKTNYKNNKSCIIISCKKHGDFIQRAQDHLNGDGCIRCTTSLEQEEITSELSKLSNNFYTNTRSIIPPLELDLYFPEQKIAVEYNGDYWHSYNQLETKDQKHKHSRKADLCESNNITLYQFGSYEWHYKKEIIISMLKHKFKQDQRVMARKCKIIRIDNRTANEFFNRTHISGHRPAHIAYGLILNNNLVSCINFNIYRDTCEIIRYSSELGFTVTGGLSRFLSHFIKDHQPNKIMTYADRRYGTGNGYIKAGFSLIKKTKPGYTYLSKLNHKTYARQKFQKHKLKNLLENFDESLSESQNMFNNGYRRLWDAGHYKYELVPNNNNKNKI